MKYRRRIYYSAEQRAEIWDRWQRGESMSSISRVFDRQSSSVFSVISPTGGIRPADRKRGKQALSLAEREEISRRLSLEHSLRAIARQLRSQAQWWICRLSCGGLRSSCVGSCLASQAVQIGLSPTLAPHSISEVAGWLKRAFPGEAQKQVSHETIYRSLYIQARGVLKKELLEHLRARRVLQRSVESTRLAAIYSQIFHFPFSNTPSIWMHHSTYPSSTTFVFQPVINGFFNTGVGVRIKIPFTGKSDGGVAGDGD